MHKLRAAAYREAQATYLLAWATLSWDARKRLARIMKYCSLRNSRLAVTK